MVSTSRLGREEKNSFSPFRQAPVQASGGFMRQLALLLFIGVFRDGMGAGLEASVDLGQLLIPFSWTSAAVHLSALFAWGT